MSNPVTERFIQCHDRLKAEKKVASSRQFAMSIDTAPQSLNQVLRKKRDVTVKNVMALVEVYNINAEFLLAGHGPMYKSEIEEPKPTKEDMVLYVPMAAHAGYCDQFNEPVLIDELERFSIPGYQPRHGEHRCFDVAGDSMEPTLFSGDKIVCSKISSDYYFNSIKDNYVYVVITQNDIVVKRIVNNIAKNGTIELTSDNSYYKPYTINAQDLVEIWAVKMKISPFMPNPANVRNAFHTEIDNLRQTISSQAESMAMMNKSLESLIKRNR